MKTTNGWQPATVERIRDEPRSYDIVTPTGARYRRNRRHLRPDRVAVHGDNDETTGPHSESDHESEQGQNGTHDEPGPRPDTETGTGQPTRAGRNVKLPTRLQDYIL